MRESLYVLGGRIGKSPEAIVPAMRPGD